MDGHVRPMSFIRSCDKQRKDVGSSCLFLYFFYNIVSAITVIEGNYHSLRLASDFNPTHF